MISDRFLFAQFCDDVRQELGNKLTLVGCYGPDIQVAKFPIALPKLCVFAKAITPANRPFTELALRIMNGDRPVAEIAASPAELGSPSAQPQEPSKWQIMTAVISMVPFVLERETILTVEADTEEGALSSVDIRVWRNPDAAT